MYTANAKVQEYCEKVWLDCSDRWAHAFRVQQAVNIVNTNNGIEAQNKVFKYSYLPGSIDKSVFGIVVMIVESFIPDSYQHYLDTNLQLSGSYREFKRDIPEYLHNRPPHFVRHCLRSQFEATEFAENDVKCVNFEKGEFLVRSSTNSTKLYAVKLSEPSCKCDSWRKTHFPCKHIFAVFNCFEEWNFHSLPHSYRNSVFITLDTGHFDRLSPEAPSEPCTVDEGDDCSSEGSEETTIPSLSSDEDETTAKSDTTSSQPQHVGNKQPSKSNNTKLRKRLQERIDVLRSATFVVDDSAVLENALAMVQAILKELQESSSVENGLPLRQSPAKKKLKITQVEYHKVKHTTLPARRRHKKTEERQGRSCRLGKR